MKKQISYFVKGRRADIDPLTIMRIIPNEYTGKVGSFVFLDHLPPMLKEKIHLGGMGAHPHRGIATLSYILQGKNEHFDSAGNYAKVSSGGVQWMKAGNGIIHDENLNYDTETDNKMVHSFQFWINLPAKNKAEAPEYLAIQAAEVPKKELPNNSGFIKVVVGNYEDLSSLIPNYSEQFLYHIHLDAGKEFSIKMDENIEVASFIPTGKVTANDTEFEAGEFIEFDRKEGQIEIKNTAQTAVDVLLFGGEEYSEPIVAEGPFVMNSQEEIVEAYQDFYAGKYGRIKN